MKPLDSNKSAYVAALKEYTIWLVCVWFCFYLVGIGATKIYNYYDLTPRDSSDPERGRSGMNVRTDALTGCQYLESSAGFLTPRVDSDNQMVCSEGE